MVAGNVIVRCLPFSDVGGALDSKEMGDACSYQDKNKREVKRKSNGALKQFSSDDINHSNYGHKAPQNGKP